MKLKPTDVPATSPLPPGAVIACRQFWRSCKDAIPLILAISWSSPSLEAKRI